VGERQDLMVPVGGRGTSRSQELQRLAVLIGRAALTSQGAEAALPPRPRHQALRSCPSHCPRSLDGGVVMLQHKRLAAGKSDGLLSPAPIGNQNGSGQTHSGCGIINTGWRKQR
jgi:hypothetical protein